MPDRPTIKTETLSYAPKPTLRDRFGRYLPSSEQVVQFLKTLVWVTPLTLLIWVYAEREQTVKSQPLPVSIDVKTVDHNRLVTLRRPPDKNILVELSGPRSKLDRVQDLLQPKPDGAAVTIYVDPQIGLGGQELLTVSQINNNPVFKNNGITVKSAQPPYLFVDIDRFEEVDAIVQPPAGMQGVLENARFVPDRVKIRAPSQLLHKAESELKGKPIAVFADLSKREELKGRTGKVDLENVPVYWTYRENVYLSPLTVTANLVVKQEDVQYTIPSVLITKETPSGLDDRYQVDYVPSITNVVVKGPADAIEALKSGTGKEKLRARLEILQGDPPRTPIKRQLQFNLPPGVRLTDDSLQKANWTFELKDR